MSEGMANIGAPLKEAMERTPKPDGSLINEGTKKPEQEPVALPDDFELLPVDPTPEMKSAAVEVELFDSDTGKDYMLSWEEAEQIYLAMLNAAPTPPQPKEPEKPIAYFNPQVKSGYKHRSRPNAVWQYLGFVFCMDKGASMEQYFKTRLQILRFKYRETTQIEFEYRYRELMRTYENWKLDQARAVS
jgi:hypothetical protein